MKILTTFAVTKIDGKTSPIMEDGVLNLRVKGYHDLRDLIKYITREGVGPAKIAKMEKKKIKTYWIFLGLFENEIFKTLYFIL